MKRMLCLWLPNWPIQRLWTAQPELRRRPLVLFAEAARSQQVVTACCPAARRIGIRPGMPLAEAHTSQSDQYAGGWPGLERRQERNPGITGASRWSSPGHPPLHAMAHDSASDRAILKRLAWDCDRFAPIVGLEEAEAPECLLLEVTGCGPVFHGEENLARQLQQQMQQRGLSVRIAIAGSIGLAWALAHSRLTSRRTVCISPEKEPLTVRRLPVELLRLPENILAQLQSLDLRTIGQLQELPRESLPSRFGDELLERLDQLTGRRAETITPERRPEPVKASWESELPLREEATVDVITGGLLRTIAGKLQTRGEGVHQLTGKFRDAEGKAMRLSLELLRPSNDADHLLDLLSLQWEQLTFSEGLVRISLECISTLPIPVHQQSLLETGEERDLSRHRDALIERLSSRLGREAVLRPQLLPEPVPEQAQEFVPCLDTLAMFREGEAPAEPRSRLIAQSRSGSAGASPSRGDISRRDALRRPLWLKASPERIEVLSVVPDGPPYQFRWENDAYPITHACGPERITAGWWSGPHVRRDYYHVETKNGRRFWLYRDLKDHTWFLHATFD